MEEKEKKGFDTELGLGVQQPTIYTVLILLQISLFASLQQHHVSRFHQGSLPVFFFRTCPDFRAINVFVRSCF